MPKEYKIAVKRPPRIEGDIVYIPLSAGEDAIIDLADLPKVGGYNWSGGKGNRPFRSSYGK